MTGHFSLCSGELCIGCDGGDAVSAEYSPAFEFTNGTIIKVVFDVADDAYIDVERHLPLGLETLLWSAPRCSHHRAGAIPARARYWPG